MRRKILIFGERIEPGGIEEIIQATIFKKIVGMEVVVVGFISPST